ALSGFIVRDPWTGYAVRYNNGTLPVGQRNLSPGYANGPLPPVVPNGLGFRSWLRYGFYNVNTINGPVTLPGAWFRHFNPVGNYVDANKGPAPFRSQYDIAIEPIGPELPDLSDTNLDTLPAP